MPQNTMTSAINVHWTGFYDDESGMGRIQLGIGSTQSTPDIVGFRDFSGDYASFTDLSDLYDGHKYFALILVTNKAGLSLLSSSDPFWVDRSPPSDGFVRDGVRYGKPDVNFQDNTTHAGCHWSGFSDPHSGIRYYSAGLGTRPLEDDVMVMSSTGTKEEINWQHIFVPGVKYFCTVKACNGAGLCSSVSSNGFITDNSQPISGIVHVGVDGHHSKYWAHPDTIQAQWFGFSDVESGIRHYEVCIRHVGSDTCDILPFTNFLLAEFMTHTISLPLVEALCVVVKAENHLGMSASSVSDSFIIDPTPPVLITAPVLESEEGYTFANGFIQFDPSILKLFWMFEDLESPIVKHIISVKTHNEGHTPVEKIHLTNINKLRISLWHNDLLKQGDTYIATITSCNEAGLCTSADSNSLLIDPTPPHLGGVTDPMSWSSVTTSAKAITTLNISLSGFKDVESGIKMYHIIVGETYSGAELSDGVQSFTPVYPERDNETVQILLNTNIRPGQLLIISVWAENHAGLNSTVGKVTVTVLSSNHIDMDGDLEILRHSCDVHYCNKDCTCAVIGQKCHNVDIISECKYINQTDNLSLDINIVHVSTTKPASASSACISAYWTATGSEVENITRYEWSLGQEDMPVGTGIFDLLHENLWHDVGHQTAFIHCLSGDRKLQHDSSYVAYVRAWTSASSLTVFTSSPVRVDNTAPSVRRGRYIIESNQRKCDVDLDFTTTQNTSTACWPNVFTDPQSGIDSYLVSMGTSPGVDSEDQRLIDEVKKQTSLKQFQATHLLLTHGTMISAVVTCLNDAKLKQVVSVGPKLISYLAPNVGNAKIFFNTMAETSSGVPVIRPKSDLVFSWGGVDDSYGIEGYKYRILQGDHVTREWEDTKMRNFVSVDDVSLTDNRLYTVEVLACNHDGVYSDAFNASVLVLGKAPSHTGNHPTVVRQGNIAEISWRGVFSLNPNLLATYVLSVGSEEGLADVIRRVETTEQRHVFEMSYSGSDVFTVLKCLYNTGVSFVYRGSLTLS